MRVEDATTEKRRRSEPKRPRRHAVASSTFTIIRRSLPPDVTQQQAREAVADAIGIIAQGGAR